MRSALVVLALSSLSMMAGEPPPVSLVATYPEVSAGSDAFEADFLFRNDSTAVTWCLVWYGSSTAHADPATRSLSYSEDLNRNPELASCGGMNAFQHPVYKCMAPGQEVHISERIWIVLNPPSSADMVRELGRPKPGFTLRPGAWNIASRFAFLEERLLPKGLEPVELCKYLTVSEQHIEVNQQLSVRPDPVAAWNTRWRALKGLVESETHGQYLLDLYVKFFEELTGIESGLRRSPGGPVFDRKQLDKALSNWDAWYREHGHDLHWDSLRLQYIASSKK